MFSFHIKSPRHFLNPSVKPLACQLPLGKGAFAGRFSPPPSVVPLRNPPTVCDGPPPLGKEGFAREAFFVLDFFRHSYYDDCIIQMPTKTYNNTINIKYINGIVITDSVCDIIVIDAPVLVSPPYAAG